MALTTRPLTTTARPAPDTAERATQIADQLRYLTTVIEMLAGGTWSAAAGAQLDTTLGAVALAAGQLGLGELDAALDRVRGELAACVRRGHAPEPLALAAWHGLLTRPWALGRLPAASHAAPVPRRAVPGWHEEAPR